MDTEYFYIKFLEELANEVENNNTVTSANLINEIGKSVYGTTYYGEYDYYKIVINETSNFSIAYWSDIQNPYEPLLIKADGTTQITLKWTAEAYGSYTVWCTSATLSPGTYYIRINGRSYSQEQYYLYSFWRSLEDYENFPGSKNYSDMLS
jgi:hypothetical protein